MSVRLLLVSFAFVLLISAGRAAPRSEDEYNENAYDDEPARRQAYSFDPNVYNPSARDFTERCMRMAQYSGTRWSGRLFTSFCLQDLDRVMSSICAAPRTMFSTSALFRAI